jgi:uncharacterized protein YrrD
MIILGSALIDTPVMGLQTGLELARTARPVIDPKNLAVIAYELKGGNLTDHPSLLRIADVRELSEVGFIVDSSEEFITPSDVVKIDEIYSLNFYLDGMNVTDEKRRKLGKVIDYTLDTTGFVVQQLTVKRPMLQSFNDTELVIHRSQIIEINDDAIVVHSQAKIPEPDRKDVIGSYVNPFRKTDTAKESIVNRPQR